MTTRRKIVSIVLGRQAAPFRRVPRRAYRKSASKAAPIVEGRLVSSKSEQTKNGRTNERTKNDTDAQRLAQITQGLEHETRSIVLFRGLWYGFGFALGSACLRVHPCCTAALVVEGFLDD